jgi:hypothetical protein
VRASPKNLHLKLHETHASLQLAAVVELVMVHPAAAPAAALAARFAAVENLAAVELERAVRCEPVVVNRTILQINQGLSSPREPPPPPVQSPPEPP